MTHKARFFLSFMTILVVALSGCSLDIGNSSENDTQGSESESDTSSDTSPNSSEEIRTYTITWLNHDNSVLEVDEEVPHGTLPTYDGETPTRIGNAQYEYTFKEWTPEIAMATSDQAYTATYLENVKTYTVTWKNHDGSTLEVDEDVPHGTIPTYDGETPTKSGDAQYSYAFSGWSPMVTSVTSNATYTAQFTSSTNAYTITWKNYDGTILEIDTNVPYGTMPVYDGSEPTKTGNAQYAYSFLGWSPEIESCSGNKEYIACFAEVVNAYTILWVNYDRTVLETDENVPYGATPSYEGPLPTKEGNAQYVYSFSGWSPSISDVTSDATYTAQFSEELNTYTITWQNYDGIVLEIDYDVPYGELPTFNGVQPMKTGNAQYAYSFLGWSPEISPVTRNQIYVAQFGETVNTYTIVWKNHDSTVLETDTNVPYGTMPVYNGPEPTKSKDSQYIYVFSGWSPELTNVTNDAVYIAQYTSSENVDLFEYTEFADYVEITGVTDNTIMEANIPSSINGKHVSIIARYAFSNCTSLTSVTIGSSVTSIGDYAFALCASLTSITIPDSVTYIGNSAFSDCTSLTSVTIGSSVTSIGHYAFWGCTSLTSIEVNENNLLFSSLDGVLYDKDKTQLIQYPIGKPENEFAIPDSVTSIGNYAFYDCTSLTIYAEAESKPSGWSDNWNLSNRPVVWGYTG